MPTATLTLTDALHQLAANINHQPHCTRTPCDCGRDTTYQAALNAAQHPTRTLERTLAQLNPYLGHAAGCTLNTTISGVAPTSDYCSCRLGRHKHDARTALERTPAR